MDASVVLAHKLVLPSPAGQRLHDSSAIDNLLGIIDLILLPTIALLLPRLLATLLTASSPLIGLVGEFV